MSKIIKANNLLIKSDVYCPNLQQDLLTQQDVDALYQEAKNIVAELIREGEKKAKSIINNAKQEAQAIINQAQGEGEALKKQGYQDGLVQGRDKGQKELEGLKAEAKGVIAQAFQERQQIIQGTEEEIINLALKIAEKILKQKVEQDQTVKAMAQQLLEMTRNAQYVILKCCPLDYEYLKTCEGQLQPVISQGELKIEVDNSLKKGELILISETGIIEAKLSPQLEQLKKALRDVNPHA